jgi:hypothetical protein
MRPRRAIGSMVMQVVTEEDHQDTLEITDHPVEQGATISDHAFKRPSEVTIKGAWSASPSVAGLIDGAIGGLKSTITGAQAIVSGKAPQTLVDRYTKLLELQKSAVPFEIYTGKRKYSNMLIRTLSVTTNKGSENSLEVTLQCREVQIVSTSVLTVSTDPSVHADPGSTVPPISMGTKSLVSGAGYSNAGAGKGFTP